MERKASQLEGYVLALLKIKRLEREGKHAQASEVRGLLKQLQDRDVSMDAAPKDGEDRTVNPVRRRRR